MQNRMVSEEIRYRLFQYVAAHPEATQREVARALGVSLGKANYCLKALILKGWIKVRNFRNSRNKAGYLYLLTPRGIQEKVHVTSAFLQRKMNDYVSLKKEIDHMTAELHAAAGAATKRSRT